SPPCEHCGRSDSDRDPVVIRTAQLVIDRCGLGPAATLLLQRANQEPADWVYWMSDERLQQVGAWIEEAKQLMAANAPRGDDARRRLVPPPDVIDVQDTTADEDQP